MNDSANFIALSQRNGICTFVGNIEFERDGLNKDEACLLLCREFMGTRNMFVFPLCDAWTVREPEFFKATMQDAAQALFCSPTKNDEHIIGDLILRDIEQVIAWRPDDDASYDKVRMNQGIEEAGAFIQVNGQTIVDAR